MSVDPGSGPDAESPAMRAFLAERRVAVLDRAIATLTSCPDADLAAEAHRLAGTRGIFGFDEASVRMRALMQAVEDAKGDPAVARDARANGLDYLQGIRARMGEKDPGWRIPS